MKKREEILPKIKGYQSLLGMVESGDVKLPDSGIASVAWGYNENGYEHVSVSPYKDKTPTWRDMCFVKDLFWEDEEEVYQIHPRKSEYVDVKKNCLHLWRYPGFELPHTR